MNYKDRISLRTALLKEIYDDYFANDGKKSKLVFEPHETEKQLAMNYLADKNLIYQRLIRQEPVLEYETRITVKGIDAVENEIPLFNI